jgi:hypothetical protein
MKRERLNFIYIAALLTSLTSYHGSAAIASIIKHAPSWGSIFCTAILLPAIYLHWRDRPHDL